MPLSAHGLKSIANIIIEHVIVMSTAIFISLYLNEKNIIFDVGMNITEYS